MSKQTDEKRELLKLKQGLIEKSDMIEQEIHEEIEKPKGMKRIENYFYRNKWYAIATVFLAFVVIFMGIQMFTREKADLSVMLVTSDNEKTPLLSQKVKDIEQALEMYCPDFDSNGYVHVDVLFVDISPSNDTQLMQSNSTKLFGEIQRGVSELYICDRNIFYTEETVTYDEVGQEGGAADYSSFFADIGEAVGLSEYNGTNFIKIAGTQFAADAKWENSCPEVLGFSIRKEEEGMISYEASQPYQQRAKQVLYNILTGNVVNETAAASSQ